MIEILDMLLGRESGRAMDGESQGSAFLRRRRERQIEHEIKTRTVLGLVLGSILLFVSFTKLYLVPTNWPQLFACLAATGFLVVATAVLLPQLLFPVETALRLVGMKIGEWVLLAVLGGVYLTIVTPVGFLIRRLRGATPIYQWSIDAPRDGKGWHAKRINPVVKGKSGFGGNRIGMLGVFSFFVNRGKIVLLPAVVILVAFGIAFYFVKTSVLAPFIYTLF